MPNVHETVRALAEKFATELLVAVRGMSLDEILDESSTASRSNGAKPVGAARRRGPPKTTQPSSPRKPGRPPKVSVDAVVAVLKQHASGLRAAELRKAIGVKRSTWKYLMPKAIAEKRVGMRGAKSKAIYFAT